MTPRHRKARQLDLLSQADGGFCLVGERTQDGARLLREREEEETRARRFEEAQRDLFPPLYVFQWGNNAKRATLKGRTCRVIARGTMNSALVEFTDNGQQEVISRNALRKQ